jgi:hypothetical protein
MAQIFFGFEISRVSTISSIVDKSVDALDEARHSARHPRGE